MSNSKLKTVPKMDPTKKFALKECSVILEPITPQKQLALSAELRTVINERNILTTRTKSRVIKALDEINNSPVKPNPLKEQALEELLNSEVSYLKQLEVLARFFIGPIKERGLLSKEEFDTMFGNIETIYGVNGELLNQLKRDSSNVGQAFKNMAPCFKLYSMYAYGYKNAMELLQRAAKKQSLFTKFVEQQESRPEVQSKLSALLIAPIQRIPRYRLLLKQILDYTSPVDGDFLALKSALKMIEEAAKHINRLVEQQERTQEMLELQRCLANQQPSLIKPGRYIIKQGVLRKMAKNGTHSYKRYFVLMNDIAMYCKIKSSNPKSTNSLICSTILPLSKCKISEISNKGCFKINCQDEEVIFYDTRVSETQDWVEQLKVAVKRYLDNRLTLRKENTIRRPVKRKHFDEFESADLSPGKPLRKRLLLEKEEYENVYKIQSDSEDSDSELKSCFRISKRRSIKKCLGNNEKSMDSLYPMRAEIGENSLEETNETNAMQIAKTDDVFVFGSRTNENRGFGFKMGNLFRNVINMFKWR